MPWRQATQESWMYRGTQEDTQHPVVTRWLRREVRRD